MDSVNVSLVVNFSSQEFNLDDDVTELVRLVCYVVMSPVISIIGIMANSVNIIVYYKHGLHESVNISFLTLAVNDLAGLIFCVWYGIGTNPLMISKTDLPFNPTDLSYLTGAFPRVLFSKMTCWITVYVSLERCVCVVAPLHVKTLITPTKTVLILTLLYIAGVVTNFPLLYLGALFLNWKYDPVKNITILGMSTRDNYFIISVISSPINTITFLISFVLIILSTLILVIELHRKSKWRQNSGSIEALLPQNSLNKRNTTLVKTIVVLSVGLIFCYLPYTANCMLGSLLDEFRLYGKYNNLFIVMWSFSWLFETFNCTTSMFIYYKVSTKYRETCRYLFTCFSFNRCSGSM